jgi:hypothetical protein
MPDAPFIPRSKTIAIGGVPYMIAEMLASQRTVFLFESSDILGGSFPIMLENYFADTEKLGELGVTGITRGIFQGSNKSPEECAAFIKKTIMASVKSPKAACVDAEYDLHFTQHYEHLPELLEEIYQLNFGPVIQGLKKKLQNSGIFTPKSSESPPKANAIAQNIKSAKPSLKPNFSGGQ